MHTLFDDISMGHLFAIKRITLWATSHRRRTDIRIQIGDMSCSRPIPTADRYTVMDFQTEFNNNVDLSFYDLHRPNNISAFCTAMETANIFVI